MGKTLFHWLFCFYITFQAVIDVKCDNDIKLLLSRINSIEDQLQHTDHVFENKVKQLEEIVISQQVELQKQSETIRSLETKLGSFCKKDKDDITNLKANQSYGISSERTRRSSVISVPAFSAYLSNTISSLSINKPILFNVVTMNEGSGYDSNTGVFVCPVSGLYMFSWNIMVDSPHATGASLRVNGQTSRWSVAHSTAGRYINAGNSDIVRLQTGDRVWMAIYQDEGELHPHHTTFSGFWINE